MSIELARELAELDKVATEDPWEAVDMDDVDQEKQQAMEIATVGWFADVCLGHRTPGYPGGNYRDTDYGAPLTDASLCAALRNNLPAILRALCVQAAVEERNEHGPRRHAHLLERADELLAELGVAK